MRFSVAALAVTCALGAHAASAGCEKPRDFSVHPKIVGGSLASIRDWPGQAVLRLRRQSDGYSFYFCGGTAITPSTVLTAAHCVDELKRDADGSFRDSFGWPVEVVLGTDRLNSVAPTSIRQVRDIVTHPEYTSAETGGNDIALVTLTTPWNGRIARISLNHKADPGDGKMVMVGGFGAHQDKDAGTKHTAANGEVFEATSDRLFEVGLPTVAQSTCKSTYPHAAIGRGQICAGYVRGGKDSCEGDSGGPLVAFDRQGCPYEVGVVSWGKGCAQAHAYGVYTRISAYADWLKEKASGALDGLSETDFDDRASLALVQASFTQLEDALGAAKGRANVSLNAGNVVKLGEAAHFTVKSSVAGTLVLVDINANGEVAQLFPNKFSAARELAAGHPITIPDNTNYRFPAQEPVGKGRLVAIIAPKDFDAAALVAEPERLQKGFGVEANPESYLMNLIALIRRAQGMKDLGAEAEGSLPGWAMGSAQYEIVR